METLNKVKNNINDSKHTRKKNLIPALNQALDYLDASTDWVARNHTQVDINCCGSCIFGSSQFKDSVARVTYNVQDYDSYNQAYKENREATIWDGKPESHKYEYIYLQHSAESHKQYLDLFRVLNEFGIYADWNWSSDLKIKVFLGKYKEEVS